MPELPEVETIRRGLVPVLTGRRLVRAEVRRADLRVPFPENFAVRLAGRKVQVLRRRAKYLLADLDGGETLVAHVPNEELHGAVEGDRIGVDLRNPKSFLAPEHVAEEDEIPPDAGPVLREATGPVD